MIVKVFIKGPIDANNYLLIDENTNDAILIDCSDNFVDEIKHLGVNLKYILLTHGHYDHILGVEAFKKAFGVNVFINENDLTQVKAAGQMMQIYSGMQPQEITTEFEFIEDGDELEFGSQKIRAIGTPGHTEGGMSYFIDDKLFSGDTLFFSTVGRSDLAGGNWRQLLNSVRDNLFLLPDNTQVFPGHGQVTTIAYEKKFNEILNI